MEGAHYAALHCRDAALAEGVRSREMCSELALTSHLCLHSASSLCLPVLQSWDATELAATYSGPAASMLIDQGSADEFLTKGQLLPENLQAAVAARGDKSLSVEYRLQDGYDHSYFFIHSFINDHIAFHAKHLHKQ